MITIRKAVARRVPPDELRAGLAALSPGPGAAGHGSSGSDASGPDASGPDDAAAAARLRELARQQAIELIRSTLLEATSR